MTVSNEAGSGSGLNLDRTAGQYQLIKTDLDFAAMRNPGNEPRNAGGYVSFMGIKCLTVYMTNDDINATAGAIAGLVAGVAVCPLDVAKTKLQAQAGFSSLGRSISNGLSYHGIWGTLAQIYHEDGIRGYYRGLTPIVIGYVPTWTVYFFLYGKTKRLLAADPLFKEYPSASHVISAVTAGGAGTLLTNPIWVVKTRLMSQGAQSSWKSYHGTFDAIKNIFRSEGIGAFYSGLGPALLGLSHVALQFPLYEKFKQMFLPAHESDHMQQTSFAIILSSALSKLIASTITYPHEVLRTRNQINVGNKKYRGVLKTAKTILQEEGIRGFYAGLGTTLFRAIPSSIVTLYTYETIASRLKRIRKLE